MALKQIIRDVLVEKRASSIEAMRRAQQDVNKYRLRLAEAQSTLDEHKSIVAEIDAMMER